MDKILEITKSAPINTATSYNILLHTIPDDVIIASSTKFSSSLLMSNESSWAENSLFLQNNNNWYLKLKYNLKFFCSQY